LFEKKTKNRELELLAHERYQKSLLIEKLQHLELNNMLPPTLSIAQLESHFGPKKTHAAGTSLSPAPTPPTPKLRPSPTSLKTHLIIPPPNGVVRPKLRPQTLLEAARNTSAIFRTVQEFELPKKEYGKLMEQRLHKRLKPNVA